MARLALPHSNGCALDAVVRPCVGFCERACSVEATWGAFAPMECAVASVLWPHICVTDR